MLMVLKKSSIQRVKYGTIIKCEGIIKAILENPKVIKIHFFADVLFLNHLELTFSQGLIFVATLHFSSKWLQWLIKWKGEP